MLTENSSGLVDRALAFARAAHESVNQRRKYTGEPYVTHPIAVAAIVKTVHHTEAMLAAALLHDTVEDTSISLDEIHRVFGFEVAGLVEMLTDVSKASDGNRAVRKTIDREHTAKASSAAKTIKLADLIDNTRSIVEHDVKFARIYLAEKALLLEVLREGDEALWNIANNLVQQHRDLIAP